MAVLYDVDWYVKHRNLSNDGVEVKSLTNRDIPDSVLDLYFGPKVDKNGWQYTGKRTKEEIKKILALYQRVTGEEKIQNNQLSATFARAVIADFGGTKVKWASFAATLRQHRHGLKITKAVSQEKKLEEGILTSESIQLVFPLRRRTSFAPLVHGSLDLPCEGSLLKREDSDCFFLPKPIPMGSKSKSLSRGSFLSPNWSQSEIDSVQSILSTRRLKCEEIKSALSSFLQTKDDAEMELRRCRMNVSDRRAMHAQSKVDLESTITSLEAAKCSYKQQMGCLMALESEPPTVDLCERVLKLRLEVQSSEANVKCLRGCLCDAEDLESRRQKNLEYDELNCQVATQNATELKKEHQEKIMQSKMIETEIGALQMQLQYMVEGGGFSFSPLPIASVSETPSVRVALLNVCPICRLWYSCHDHMFAECGHSYHPWCLARYSFLHRKCVIPECELEFGDAWCMAWGIRPRVVENLGSGSERPPSKRSRKPTAMASCCPDSTFTYGPDGSSTGSKDFFPALAQENIKSPLQENPKEVQEARLDLFNSELPIQTP